MNEFSHYAFQKHHGYFQASTNVETFTPIVRIKTFSQTEANFRHRMLLIKASF